MEQLRKSAWSIASHSVQQLLHPTFGASTSRPRSSSLKCLNGCPYLGPHSGWAWLCKLEFPDCLCQARQGLLIQHTSTRSLCPQHTHPSAPYSNTPSPILSVHQDPGGWLDPETIGRGAGWTGGGCHTCRESCWVRRVGFLGDASFLGRALGTGEGTGRA